jgi:hypothetical protein
MMDRRWRWRLMPKGGKPFTTSITSCPCLSPAQGAHTRSLDMSRHRGILQNSDGGLWGTQLRALID